MDKFLPVTTKSTRNELLMQLMQESKSTNLNVVLVVESLPTFINTSVSLAVFNAMLKQYPKNLYWFSNNLAIINFLKISNITSIWKPPINTQPSKLSEQLSTYVSQSNQTPARVVAQPSYNNVGQQNTNDLRASSNPNSNNNYNSGDRSESGNRNSVTANLQPAPNLQLSQVFSDLQPKISTNQGDSSQSYNPSRSANQQLPPQDKVASKLDSRLYKTTHQIKQKLAKNIALLPKFKTKSAETLSLQDDINQIQAPDFNNLDDLISKIESTKEALEKKHNKLNKNLLDSEISMDAKNNMGWLLVLGVGLILLVISLIVFWYFKGR